MTKNKSLKTTSTYLSKIELYFLFVRKIIKEFKVELCVFFLINYLKQFLTKNNNPSNYSLNNFVS